MGRPESEEVNKGSATTDTEGPAGNRPPAPSLFPLRIETQSPGLGGGRWGGEVGKVEGKAWARAADQHPSSLSGLVSTLLSAPGPRGVSPHHPHLACYFCSPTSGLWSSCSLSRQPPPGDPLYILSLPFLSPVEHFFFFPSQDPFLTSLGELGRPRP